LQWAIALVGPQPAAYPNNKDSTRRPCRGWSFHPVHTHTHTHTPPSLLVTTLSNGVARTIADSNAPGPSQPATLCVPLDRQDQTRPTPLFVWIPNLVLAVAHGAGWLGRPHGRQILDSPLSALLYVTTIITSTSKWSLLVGRVLVYFIVKKKDKFYRGHFLKGKSDGEKRVAGGRLQQF